MSDKLHSATSYTDGNSYTITGLSKSYDGVNYIFNNENFYFAKNKITAILGASGCGKTTLLNVIAGLCPAEFTASNFLPANLNNVRTISNKLPARNLHRNSNNLHIRNLFAKNLHRSNSQASNLHTSTNNLHTSNSRASNSQACNLPVSRAYCFQEPRLLPWLSTYENLLLPFAKKERTPDLHARLEKLLTQCELYEARHKLPRELSGGMQQRLGLIRAFAVDAEILLLDEAFKAQDVKMKAALLDFFLALWQEKKTTVIAVSHDIEEAVYIADRVIVLGNKPATIIYDIEINEVHSTRRLGSGESQGIVKDLYGVMLGV